jgi:hypothetical protein
VPASVASPPGWYEYRGAVALTGPAWRTYRYVGPADLRYQTPTADAVVIEATASLDGWLAQWTRTELAEPFTFVVTLDGMLRLAPRRSEHVALAGAHRARSDTAMRRSQTEVILMSSCRTSRSGWLVSS